MLQRNTDPHQDARGWAQSTAAVVDGVEETVLAGEHRVTVPGQIAVVSLGAADQAVDAAPSPQPVRAGPAAQDVITAVPQQDVVASTADQPVQSPTGADRVVAVAPIDHVGAAPGADAVVPAQRPYLVGSACPQDHIRS